MLGYGLQWDAYLSKFTKVTMIISAALALIYMTYLIIWSTLLCCCFRQDSKHWHWSGFKLFALLSGPSTIMAFVGGTIDSHHTLPQGANTRLVTMFIGTQLTLCILSYIYMYIIDSGYWERVGTQNINHRQDIIIDPNVENSQNSQNNDQNGQNQQDKTLQEAPQHHLACQCYLIQLVIPPGLLILIVIGLIGGLMSLCCGRGGNRGERGPLVRPVENPYEHQNQATQQYAYADEVV